MPTPRRRIIRPAVPSHSPDRPCPQKLQKLRGRLDRQRAALVRWQRRLKRAFTEVQKVQKAIARLEKQLEKQEDPACRASSK